MTTTFTKEEIEVFEKEMNEIGLALISDEEFNSIKNSICVEVDLDTNVDYSKFVQSIFLKKKTKRNETFFTFIKEYNVELGRLTLIIGTQAPEEVASFYNKDIKLIGTTFADFCWYYAEGTTETTANEVVTKFRDNAIMGDLSWYLPTRFSDSFIEVMHALNQSFLEGVLSDGIVYGPKIVL
jgi:hypothetical protein